MHPPQNSVVFPSASENMQRLWKILLLLAKVGLCRREEQETPQVKNKFDF